MNALSGFKRLSPHQYALLWLAVTTVLLGSVYVLSPPGELRPGAAIFLGLFVTVVTANAYWARRREIAGLPPYYFATRGPVFSAAAAFVLVGTFGGLFVWFIDPEKNPLLYGAFIGTLMGAITYQHRRTGENSFRSFLLIYVPLAIVYIAIATYLRMR